MDVRAMLHAAMRSYVVVVLAALALAGYFGYRQWTLERRVDELTRQLGAAQSGDSVSAQASAPHEDAVAPAAPSSYADRIHALETGLASARADIRSLETATADLPEKGATDQQILSVMKEQGAKVMEKQLSFHRDRWLEQREIALNSFVKRLDLNQQQSDQLWGLLSGEIDKMVDLLKKPESFEDPERAANEWKRMLLETDSAAHKVLDPAKAVAWDQQRLMERKTLWPWLPD
jgi:hypothetical protein